MKMNFNSDIFINLPTCSFPSNGCLRAKADELIMLHKPGEMRTIHNALLCGIVSSKVEHGKASCSEDVGFCALVGKQIRWPSICCFDVGNGRRCWRYTVCSLHKNPFRINNGAKWNRKPTQSPFNYLPRMHRCSGTVITTVQLQRKHFCWSLCGHRKLQPGRSCSKPDSRKFQCSNSQSLQRNCGKLSKMFGTILQLIYLYVYTSLQSVTMKLLEGVPATGCYGNI